MEGSRLNEGAEIAAINEVLAAITSRSVDSAAATLSKAQDAIRAAAEGDFGLSAGDIQKIASKLAPGHSAIIILFENAWERKLKSITKKYDGAVVDQRLITPAALAKVAQALTQAGSS